MKISSPQYESEMANKVNNELNLTVDEQQDNIQHLKEYCDINVIEPPWKEMAMCVTCNETFATENGLNKKNPVNHTKLLWNYCGKMFK